MDTVVTIPYLVQLVLALVLAIWSVPRSSGSRAFVPRRAVTQAVAAAAAFLIAFVIVGAGSSILWTVVLLVLGGALGCVLARSERVPADAGPAGLRRWALTPWVWALSIALIALTLLFGSTFLFGVAVLAMAVALGMVLGQIAAEFGAARRSQETDAGASLQVACPPPVGEERNGADTSRWRTPRSGPGRCRQRRSGWHGRSLRGTVAPYSRFWNVKSTRRRRMGITHAHRTRRLAPALVLTTLVVMALLVALGIAARPAAAINAYVHGGASCSSCHAPSPTNASCTATCHTGGFVAHPKGGAVTTCWTCHTPGQSMANFQSSSGCGTGAAGVGCHNQAAHVGSNTKACTSCHGVSLAAKDPGQSAHHKGSVSEVTVSPLLTIKLSATSIKVNKTIKTAGLVKKPVVSTNYTVKVLVQRKNSAGKWVKVTTKTSLPTAASTWGTSYKATKKGSYRLQASTPVATGVAAGKTAWKSFKVK